jgi:hypothetical protein
MQQCNTNFIAMSLCFVLVVLPEDVLVTRRALDHEESICTRSATSDFEKPPQGKQFFRKSPLLGLVGIKQSRAEVIAPSIQICFYGADCANEAIWDHSVPSCVHVADPVPVAARPGHTRRRYRLWELVTRRRRGHRRRRLWEQAQRRRRARRRLHLQAIEWQPNQRRLRNQRLARDGIRRGHRLQLPTRYLQSLHCL